MKALGIIFVIGGIILNVALAQEHMIGLLWVSLIVVAMGGVLLGGARS